MKSFLKWVGGKTKTLPIIQEILPKEYNVYHEPFLGGGALFFYLQPKYSFLSDINEKLINAYLGVRNCVEKVIDRLELYSYNRKTFDSVRWFNFDRGEIDHKAADFIYCNKVGFNGLYRVNNSGRYNVPFGKYTNPNFCNKEVLRDCSRVLMNANLLAIPFWESQKFVKEGDLVYMDPPYIPITKTSNFTSYTKNGFDMEDQIRLRNVAADLKKRGAHVILSNSFSPLVRELYKEWNFKEVQALRSINSNSEGRGAVTELLIY